MCVKWVLTNQGFWIFSVLAFNKFCLPPEYSVYRRVYTLTAPLSHPNINNIYIYIYIYIIYIYIYTKTKQKKIQTMLISSQFYKTECDKYSVVFKLYESVSQTIMWLILLSPLFFFFLKSDRDIVNASVCLSVPLAILNTGWNLNQICFMISPHGKGVREQHYFSGIHPVSIHLPITLSPTVIRLSPSTLFNRL